ncbi:MAG: glycosyltransferase family 25 protein, partial [Parachlamydiaceae bacterium]|nr:glycosyltransferase family 25 protein [Parachlamydiaceae bacterium]
MFDYVHSENLETIPQIVHERIVESKGIVYQYSWNTPLHIIADSQLKTLENREINNNWHLGDFFGTIAVINLPTAKERLERITQELHQIGTKSFKVFKAIDGRNDLDQAIWNKMYHNRERINTSTEEGLLALEFVHKGEAGCYMSHYTLIKQVKEAFDSAMNNLELAKINSDFSAIRQAEKELRQFSRVLVLEDDAGFGIIRGLKSKGSKKDVGRLFRKALKELPENWDMLYFIAAPQTKIEKISKHLY